MRLNCLRAEGVLGGRGLLIYTHRICLNIQIHMADTSIFLNARHVLRGSPNTDTAGTWNACTPGFMFKNRGHTQVHI